VSKLIKISALLALILFLLLFFTQATETVKLNEDSTFELMLESKPSYKIDLFVKAKHIPIVAPVRFMSKQQHQQET